MLYYNTMGPPSYVWSVVDRNVVMRRLPVPLAVLSGSSVGMRSYFGIVVFLYNSLLKILIALLKLF
jgi:hypothetical protein